MRRNWTRTAARATALAAGIALAGTGLGSGTASADITNGEKGYYSGNQIYAPDNTPINICGNAIGFVSVAKAWCYGGAHVHEGKGQVTSGKHSIGGGNQIDRSDNRPINICGNSIGVVGVAKGECRGGATVNDGRGHGHSQHRSSLPSGDTSESGPEGPLSGLPTGPLAGAVPLRPINDLAGSVALPESGSGRPSAAAPKATAPRPAAPKAVEPRPAAPQAATPRPRAAKPALPLNGIKLPSTMRRSSVPSNQRVRAVPEPGGVLPDVTGTLALPTVEGLPDASGLPGAQGLTGTIDQAFGTARRLPTVQGTLEAQGALPEPALRRTAEPTPPDPVQGVRTLMESLGIPVRGLDQISIEESADEADQTDVQQGQQLQQQTQQQAQQGQQPQQQPAQAGQQPGRPTAQKPASSAKDGRPVVKTNKGAKPPLPLDGLPINVGRGTPLNP